MTLTFKVVAKHEANDKGHVPVIVQFQKADGIPFKQEVPLYLTEAAAAELKLGEIRAFFLPEVAADPVPSAPAPSAEGTGSEQQLPVAHNAPTDPKP